MIKSKIFEIVKNYYKDKNVEYLTTTNVKRGYYKNNWVYGMNYDIKWWSKYNKNNREIYTIYSDGEEYCIDYSKSFPYEVYPDEMKYYV